MYFLSIVAEQSNLIEIISAGHLTIGVKRDIFSFPCRFIVRSNYSNVTVPRPQFPYQVIFRERVGGRRAESFDRYRIMIMTNRTEKPRSHGKVCAPLSYPVLMKILPFKQRGPFSKFKSWYSKGHLALGCPITIRVRTALCGRSS